MIIIKKQFYETKRLKVQFIRWLEKLVPLNSSGILDMACGAGANTLYMGNKFPDAYFVGMDYDSEILLLGGDKRTLRENVSFELGEWYNINSRYKNYFDGIISFQTLSWLSDYKEPIQALCELNPEWIGMSSLFYEGRITYYIRIEDQECNLNGWGRNGESFYNIYSLPLVKEFFYHCGYKSFMFTKFIIDIDLPKPDDYRMGTYTITTKDMERIQVSGALFIP